MTFSTLNLLLIYLWVPMSHQISHTLNVFVFSVSTVKCSVPYSIIIRTFLCSKPLSTLSTLNCVLPSINYDSELSLFLPSRYSFPFLFCTFLLFLYYYVPPRSYSSQSISCASCYTKPPTPRTILRKSHLSYLSLDTRKRKKSSTEIYPQNLFLFISSFNG